MNGPYPSFVGLVTVIAMYSVVTVKKDPHFLMSGPPSCAIHEMIFTVSWWVDTLTLYNRCIHLTQVVLDYATQGTKFF